MTDQESNLLMCPNCSLTHSDLAVKVRDEDNNPICETCSNVMEVIKDGEDFANKLTEYMAHRDAQSDWYFTFGHGQAHPNSYIRITATSFSKAREKMFEHFDNKWCFQYSQKQWDADGNLCSHYREVQHYVAD